MTLLDDSKNLEQNIDELVSLVVGEFDDQYEPEELKRRMILFAGYVKTDSARIRTKVESMNQIVGN